MQIAPLPLNESARIELLHALRLLDTDPEEEFDRITRLLARVLDVPIALVSLIDSERQWFKSRVGLDVCETSRDVAFCAHAILASEPLVVPDALDDPRFVDNPLVREGVKIRFYAGYPLISLRGLPLGTLCAIDTRPRQMTAADRQALCDLGKLVQREILHREALVTSQSVSEHSQRVAAVTQSQLQAIFDQEAVGIAINRVDGPWLAVNHKFADIAGYAVAEMIGMSYTQLSLPEDLAQDAARAALLFSGRCDHLKFERRLQRKNGGRVWVNLSISLIRDADGAPEYFITLVEDIQPRKEAEESLRALSADLERQVEERTAELRSVIVNAQDAYVCINEQGIITDWNPQAERTFGWSHAEAIGQSMAELLIPHKQRAAHDRGMATYAATGYGPVLNQRMEMSALHRDGHEIPIEISVCAHTSKLGHSFSAFIHDISERKQAEMALRRSREQIRAIADNTPAMISYQDRNMVYQFASAGFRTLARKEPGLMIGRSVRELVGDKRADELEPYFRRALAGESVVFESFEQARGIYWQTRVEPDMKDGEAQGYYVVTMDITAVKQAELLNERVANSDPLTGLANRRALMAHLDAAIVRSERNQTALGLCFIDLNDFKLVNDQFGHQCGDELLIAVARRLQACIRNSDLIARLAGDEFIVVAESLPDGSAMELLKGKLTASLADPFSVGGESWRIQVSAGIAIREVGSAMSAVELLATADRYMYVEKKKLHELRSTTHSP